MGESGTRCWICGGKPETAEHRIKKADIVRRFGRGPHQGKDVLLHVRGDRVTPLQGASSASVKFPKSLCADCNTTLTQPFDRAYDKFIDWTFTNEAVVLKRRVLDFEEIYGEGWQDCQRDLFKFFAKVFGCRLAEAHRTVPQDVSDLLSLREFRTRLYVTFQINEDQLLLPADVQTIGTDPLITHVERTTGAEVGYHCGHHFRWLRVLYWYNHGELEPVGSAWLANSRVAYIGWCAPLTEDERQALIARLAHTSALPPA